MATVKFVLRYRTEQQKKKLEKIADKCGRSANSHILYLIDRDIEYSRNQPTPSSTTLIKKL